MLKTRRVSIKVLKAQVILSELPRVKGLQICHPRVPGENCCHLLLLNVMAGFSKIALLSPERKLISCSEDGEGERKSVKRPSVMMES